MGTMEILKVGDLVSCHYGYHVGIGYGKVLKIVDRKTKKEHQEYGPIITGRGDKNSKIDVTIQFVGYDMRDGDMEDDLGEIVLVDEIKVLDPHDIYRIVNEEMISKIRSEWERLLNSKLEFFYKHVNKLSLEGRKTIPGMKF
jgi:hypothetical protein